MHVPPVSDTGLAAALEHDIQRAEGEIAHKIFEIEALDRLATSLTIEIMGDYRWVTHMSDSALRLMRGRNNGSKL